MKSAKKFNARGFVVLIVALSGLGLPLTGIVNHLYGFSPLSVERHAWMSAHNGLGFMFVLFSIWHVVLHRRMLWKHVRRSTALVPRPSREAVLATVIVALSLLLFVGHAFVAGG